MHMTVDKPQFSYIDRKKLQKDVSSTNQKKVLQVEYQLPDDDIFGQGKQFKQITEQIKNQIKQMIKNLPKLGQQERIPYQDVVFKNLQKIFQDRRKSLPGSFIKAQKQPKEKLSKDARHRVSIQIPIQNIRNIQKQFTVQQQYYHNSDKNFEYDMKIIIKKVMNKPEVKTHPLKKYMQGGMSEFYL